MFGKYDWSYDPRAKSKERIEIVGSALSVVGIFALLYFAVLVLGG